MTSLVVANGGLLRLIWAKGGTPYAVNVIGVRDTSGTGITQGATNTLGAAIKGFLTTSGLGALLHSTVTLQTVGLRSINTANQPEFLDVAAAVAGTAGGDMLPPQVALCVTLRTALAGRSFRGRTYIPGWAESANDAGGVASAAASTGAASFMSSIFTQMATQSLPMGIVSRPRVAPLVPSAGFVTLVTALLVRDLVWDTQRRRAVAGI